MIKDKADQNVEKLFKSILNRSQNNLETSMRNSDFIFDCAHLLFYKSHEINPNRGGPYIDSTINPITKKDYKCF